MHRPLWLIILATVCEAFYDDYNLYNWDNERVDGRRPNGLHVSFMNGNFTESLRRFANTYYDNTRRGEDDKLSYEKLKARLRALNVYVFLSHSEDFETAKSSQLPLSEGSAYCTMGRNTKVGCNRCTCVAGQLYMCTGIICPITKSLKYKPNKALRATRSECVDGTSYMDDKGCNRCYCIDNTEYCTLHDCGSHGEKIRKLKSDFQCVNGTSFMDDEGCNRCFCINNHAVCTLKTCLKISDKDKALLRATRSECVEGTSYMDDEGCNRCYCIDNTEYCTLQDCGTHGGKTLRIKMDVKCVNGTSYMDDEGCNLCFCIDNNEVCTLKACIEESAFCVVGSVKQSTCGECVCTTGIWDCPSCENNVLFNKILNTRSSPRCYTGSSKMVDCGECFCVSGKWICPICDEIHPRLDMSMTRRDDRRCVHGERYKTDPCNYCVCVDGHDICTNTDCAAVKLDYVLRRKKECDVFDSKRIKCNRCTCIFGKWSCTHFKCKKKLNDNIEYISWEDDTPPEFVEMTEAEDHGQVPISNETFYSDWLTSPKHPTKHPSASDRYKHNNKKGNRLRHKHYHRGHKQDMLRMTEEEILGGENKKCKVGERFRLGACNYCYCNERGVRICSRHNCNYKSDVNKTKYSPKQYKEEQCKIGYRFRLDKCNYCYCDEHRKLICSKHKCEGSVPPPAYLRSPFDMDCEVGHVLVDSCIICTCTENKTYVCVPENKDECEPLDISQRINSDEDRCVDGSKRPVNDCNYCVCRNGIEFCTQKPCWNNIQNLSIVNQKYCVNGEVHSMNDGCNLCICMNKKIVCTKKRCDDIFRSGVTELEMVHSLLQSAYSQSQMTQPAPGSDCSQNKLYRPEDDDPDCPNVCICDGNELLCTRRKCDTKVSTFIKDKTGFRSRPTKTRYESMKRHVCNEGDQIPTDSSCLVCVCLHGGPVCKPVRCSENPNLRYDSDDESEELKKFFKGLLGTQNNFDKPGKDSTFCKPFTFFSPDGNRFCRNCFCLHNGLALCLLGLCKYHRDDHKPIVSVNQKKPCVPGDVARPGRCVYCTCSSKAVWSCDKADTDMTTCKNAICEENDEFHMGFSPYCAECKCILNQRYCSIEVKSCPDYSDVKCPIGTIIQNPREFCSICVCGGYDDGAKNMCFTEAKCVKQVINHYTL